MSCKMFCYQCEETAKGQGCTVRGVCGKEPEVAVLQDLLIYQLRGIGYLGEKLIEQGQELGEETDRFVMDALFSTLTNVNFVGDRFINYIKNAEEIRSRLEAQVGETGEKMPLAARYIAPATEGAMLADAETVGLLADEKAGEDIKSLRHLLIIGLKGLAAYAHHAAILGKADVSVNKFFYKALTGTVNDNLGVPELLQLNLELGKVNFRCMELLDEANTGIYGHPEPTRVLITKKKGPFIVISGHDLKDLQMLLEQTAGKGINIYTHGEMLPAHAYPELKKYKHLAGNYGGAWYEQQKEFAGLPGSVLMTTNCLKRPLDSYQDRVFTTSVVGWDGLAHIEEQDGVKDFTPLIEKALELGGWSEDEPAKTIMVGFARQATLSHADKIIEAVKSGNIKHFFLIGGCDGHKPGRSYFEELAEKTPQDTVILTLACGKYRFNKKELGSIGEIPRLLDVGQCNDAYSAIRIAVALAEAFECDVNELPLSLVLSWYEQKAVVILLTLLSLGIKNIRLGPSLPAFVSPNVLQVLVDNFQVTPITTVEEDLKTMLGK